MSDRRFPPVAVGLGVLGGLLLVGATSSDWVIAEHLRQIGGVPLAEPRGTAGVELAPHGVVAGLLAAGAGLALIAARGRGRRLLGVVLVIVGSVAGAFVVAGMRLALAEPGQLTPAPWVAACGALATVVAGAMAWRRPAPPPALSQRYSIDAGDADGDREWGVASDEP